MSLRTLTRAGGLRAVVAANLFAGLLALLTFASPARAADPLTEVEKLIGRAMGGAYKTALGREKDPLLQHWVDNVGGAVAKAGGVKVRFVILDTGVVNAYTLPGGTVMVTRGLLDTVSSDDELAGVLAHETAHVTRHHPRKQLVQYGALAAALTFARPKDKTTALLATAAVPLAVLAFSRSQESEADRYGVRYAARAGYDPRGLLRFLARFGEDRTPDWLQTHPSGPARTRRLSAEPLLSDRNSAALTAAAEGYARRNLFQEARETYRAAMAADPANAEAQRGLEALPPAPVTTPAPPVPNPPDLVDPARKDTIFRAARTLQAKVRRANRAALLANGLQTLSMVRAGNGSVPLYAFSAAAYAETEILNDALATMGRTAGRAALLLDRWTVIAANPGTDGIDGPLEAARCATEEVAASQVKTAEAAGMLGMGDGVLTADWLALQGGAMDANAAWWARVGGLGAMTAYAGNRIAAARGRAHEAEDVMAMARLRWSIQRLDAAERRLPPPAQDRARAIVKAWFDSVGAPAAPEGPRFAGLGHAAFGQAAALSAPEALTAALADSADRPIEEQVVAHGARPGPLASVLNHLLRLLEDEDLAV